MKRARTLLAVVVALLLFGVALLWMLPAEVALRFAAPRLAPLQLEGVAGTVWNGRALSASVFGQPLGSLRWRLQPLPMLAGTMSGDLVLEGGQAVGSGRFSQQGETLRVHDARFRVPARLLQPVLDVPALALLGEVDVEIERGLLRNGMPEELAGSALWRNAAVAGAAAAELGDIAVDFASQPDGSIAGSVHDRGGPLQVEGGFRVALTGYRAELALRAREDNPQVAEALAYLGQRHPDGSVRFIAEGSLLAW